MKQIELFAEDKCTAKIAARILGLSEDSGKRYIRRLRKVLHVEPYGFVTVGMFCDHYLKTLPGDYSHVTINHRLSVR